MTSNLSQAGGALGGLASVIAFLSIIPVCERKHAGVHSAASHMHLFPVAGMIIGCLAGLVAWGLHDITEPLLAGLLTAAFVVIITGLHHTDGLADMADGLMARGTGGYRRRLDAMKDKSTGTAGAVAVVLCVAILAAAISAAGQMAHTEMLCGIILAEVLAKFSMIVMAAVGRPATPDGTGAVFADAIKSRRIPRVAASVVIVATIIATIMILPAVVSVSDTVPSLSLPLATLAGMITASVAVPLILVAVARHNFGGITGDVFGAANEISRIAALVVLVTV